ncbi:MAG: DUF167 domain-containing protein [Alphaproteobacteria bacterium]|nr:DUF167 domain-containing protein [Alphaproteobacteria bacterium]
MAGSPLAIVADGVILNVRLTPRGGRDAIDGVDADDAGRSLLRARVSAAPSDGAANDALLRLLADGLELPRRSLTLASGAGARVKRIHVAGDPAALARHIETRLAPRPRPGQGSGQSR